MQACQWWTAKWVGKKEVVFPSTASTARDTGLYIAESSHLKQHLQSRNKPRKHGCLLEIFDPTASQLSLSPLWLLANRESGKKWCRSGDWSSCLGTGSEGSYEDTSVAISDDRTGAFTVTLKKLQLGDTGWYWCAAGQQQTAVHVLVTPRPTTSRLTKSP